MSNHTNEDLYPPFVGEQAHKARTRATMKSNTFCPSFSHDEWQLILTALKPYRHNSEYRELLERLEYQAEALRPFQQQAHAA